LLFVGVGEGTGSRNGDPVVPAISYSVDASSWIKKLCDDVVLEPKTFWSSFWPSTEIPCKLRRLATGLSWLGWSRFIVASLRFNDPLLATI
jgi:hypothetical protein